MLFICINLKYLSILYVHGLVENQIDSHEAFIIDIWNSKYNCHLHCIYQ